MDKGSDQLTNEQVELQFQFSEALDQLVYLAEEFDAESQQQWIITLQKVSELRDHLWSIQQAIEKLSDQ